MGAIVNNGGTIPTVLVEELFNGVRGESALAKISPARPIPFRGMTEFVFSMDNEASVVGESGAKVNGGITMTPVVVRPVKFEYGARFSYEMWRASEEARMNILRTFVEGARRKFARGFDIAAMHGLNPYSGTASAVIGTNNLDAQITNDITYDATTPRANIMDAVALVVAADAEINGMAISATMAGNLANEVSNGIPANPEFYNSLKPDTFLGVPAAVNTTVSSGSVAHAYLGDWNAFRWGYAEEIPYEVIEYGDPDNTGSDLKGHNQIYLRAEAFIGWAILDPSMLARVEI